MPSQRKAAISQRESLACPRRLIHGPGMARWFTFSLSFVLSIAALAQNGESVQEGERLFRANCVFCHGPEGKSGGGGVDLLQGKFKRPSSDADIVTYIRNGIPGTAMDKVNVTEEQARDIVRFMRARTNSPLINVIAGDAARGKTMFDGKGGCLKCHAIQGSGSHFGPDLSDIGAIRKPAELELSIVDPDADIAPENRIVQLVLRDGSEIAGRRLNQDTFTIQIIDAKDHLRTLERSDLRDVRLIVKSPMPSAEGRLMDGEISDLVAYLANLKGHSEETKQSHSGEAKE